jgi:uncharacterized membrane protein
MSHQGASLGPALGRKVAAVLRVGTLAAVLAVTAGFLVALLSGSPSAGARPLGDLIGAGDADSLISAGLLGLTLLPLGVLAVAARSFHLAGERRYLVACIVTLALLVASLVIAALVAPSS